MAVKAEVLLADGWTEFAALVSEAKAEGRTVVIDADPPAGGYRAVIMETEEVK